ncbi:hypothetical protein C2845_PM09G13540 [Panicum miliaceum]|uniref:Uncharacterized protein n=1 Tax=Panicum miliaceum TaxID=4540 RepID=A0A3L6S597_PANMI|nr:hypothetical protein C2845_PM09G13540 [Panicum miliaceum]
MFPKNKKEIKTPSGELLGACCHSVAATGGARRIRHGQSSAASHGGRAPSPCLVPYHSGGVLCRCTSCPPRAMPATSQREPGSATSRPPGGGRVPSCSLSVGEPIQIGREEI